MAFVGTSQELIYFFGRLHVLLLHLPIGILLLAVALEIISRRERFRHLQSAVGFVWAMGAISAVGTATLGYMHSTESGFEGSALDAHRLAGTSLALLACAVWIARTKFSQVYARAWPAGSAAIVLLLLLTGHFGGNLTHGDTYLAQYAPGPLRSLLGYEDAPVTRAKPVNLDAADIYLDVVAPSLQQRCGNCHNDNKRKGELSMASYASLLKGGKNGAVIVPGRPAASDLIRRINLGHDDKDFMPHDGKTPLTSEQTAAITWWVSIGAPRTAAIAKLQAPPATRAALESVLGLGKQKLQAGDQQAASNAAAPPPNIPPAEPDIVNSLESSGFVVRPIAVGNPLVQVDFTANRQITDAELAELAKIGPQIHALNLRSAGVGDMQLATIGRFDNLASLRLELNPITDAGVSRLLGLNQLEYLNLYGTKVSDAGVAQLSHLERLHKLFVWQTAITTAGIAELKRTRSELIVNGGFDPRNFPAGPTVIPVVN
jgi:uncharacterized membrane protein